jgi:hypothetical protein
LVRSQKQKKLITRIIPEDVYWDYREEYENTLELGKTTKGVDDYLFPSKSLDNTYLKKPLSSSDIRRIISGYWGYYKGNKSKYYPGVCERVWGRRMWTHIFRHARTNDLLSIWPIEAVQLWRGDSSINTTRIYADEEQIKKQMFENLDKKDVNDWGELEL